MGLDEKRIVYALGSRARAIESDFSWSFIMAALMTRH